MHAKSVARRRPPSPVYILVVHAIVVFVKNVVSKEVPGVTTSSAPLVEQEGFVGEPVIPPTIVTPLTTFVPNTKHVPFARTRTTPMCWIVIYASQRWFVVRIVAI